MTKNFVSPKIYGKIASLVPISCVDIVIKKGRQFLLIKRKENPVKNKWWFAGGRVMFGEKILGTVKRKLKEELNIKSFRKIKPLGVAEIKFSKNRFGKPEHDIVHVFLVEAGERDCLNIKPDKTMYGYRWFKRIENNFHPHVKKYLRLAGL